jgi:hypothetical protein
MEDNKNAEAMTTVLRRFGEHRQEAEDPDRRDWKWRDGTILFPEGRCCYCGEPVRSNRLWVVESGWLRGQLDVEKGVFEKPEHPHAGTDGGLCLGDSNNPIDALFFGVNPSDPLRRDMNIPKWYAKMFGHTCNSKDALKPSELFPGGNGSYDEDEDEGCESCCHCCDRECCTESGIPCDCGCDECYCRTPNCFNCNEAMGDDWGEIHNGDRYRYFCHECWSATHFRCTRCLGLFPVNETVEMDGEKYDTYCAGYMQRQRERIAQARPRITLTPSASTPPMMRVAVVDGVVTLVDNIPSPVIEDISDLIVD